MKSPNEVTFDPAIDLQDSALRRRVASFPSTGKTIGHLTDSTNAEMVAKLYGDRLRFDHKRRRWLIWQGHRWQPDTDGSIHRFALETARKRYQDAVEIEDFEERKKVSKWAIQSEARNKLDDALSIAKSLLPIADKGENWDQNKMLLSCPNGIVDLVAGEIREGTPEDRITMSTRIEFDKEKECPRWELFINEIFEGNKDLIHFVHKALGYSITGSTKEQVAFFCYGSGSNGKSVLFKTINEILGDYSYDAPASLLKRYSQSTASNDEAATEFKRFLVLSETLSSAKINEERLKKWTGGDRVTARYLYQENFTFEPTVKPWLFINHKPQVDDDSYAFWRRVRAIPFNRKFEGDEADQDLPEKLLQEAEGILAWLIKGCLIWQEEGLKPIPEVINEATSVYRSENDDLFEFIADIYPETIDEVKALEAYKSYISWTETQGLKSADVLSKTAFGRKMADKFQKVRKNTGIYYKSVGLCIVSVPECIVRPQNIETPHERVAGDSLYKMTPNYTPVPRKSVNPTPFQEKTDLQETFELEPEETDISEIGDNE